MTISSSNPHKNWLAHADESYNTSDHDFILPALHETICNLRSVLKFITGMEVAFRLEKREAQTIPLSPRSRIFQWGRKGVSNKAEVVFLMLTSLMSLN